MCVSLSEIVATPVGDDRVDFDLFQNTLPTAPLIEDLQQNRRLLMMSLL